MDEDSWKNNNLSVTHLLLFVEMFASGKMLQSSFSFSFLQVLLATSVLAQNETEKLPGFGDSVQILGAVSPASF